MYLKQLIIEEQLRRRRRKPAFEQLPLEVPRPLPRIEDEYQPEDEEEKSSHVIIIDMFDYTETEV